MLLVVSEADGCEDRWLELFGLSVLAGGAVALWVGVLIADPWLEDAATGAPTGATLLTQRVDRPPFRLIGAVQDFRLDQ